MKLGEKPNMSPISSSLNSAENTIVNGPNNENRLKISDASISLEKTGRTNERVIALQKEVGKVELAEEEETIEKIAEMIAISSKDTVDNNTKTKKRLQVLMTRNQYLQTDGGSTSANCNETNIYPLKVNTDDAFHQINLVNDQSNKKRKHVPDSPKGVCDMQHGTSIIKSSETHAESLLEKNQFEEVEDKLEEMFAGIEDEKLVNTSSDDKIMIKNSNEPVNKYLKADCKSTDVNYCEDMVIDNNYVKHDISELNKSTLPTKAAKKSTTLLYNTANTKQFNLLLKDHKNPFIPKSVFYLETIPPRRRLSIGISKELLKQSSKATNEVNEEKNGNGSDIVKEKDVMPLSLNLPTKREAKQIKKNSHNSNQKKCSKFKQELTYMKSNNCTNKKMISKSEVTNKIKQSSQKIMQSRMHRLLYSENGTEDKHLNTKDIEIKNRSPFILVKNNGTIAVVNNVAPDENHDKLTRSKKSNNYACERKTVKGCHSSTLSNRYDADTADSSWKCVFCKIGPHRKGLGDLFGPYIITSDCDEFRSLKDYLENCHKFEANDTHLLNFTNVSVKSINRTSNSHIQNISESKYENLIKDYEIGMSQVSLDCYEIWVHEECAIWAPNIYVVGSRLTGLEQATWNGIRYKCVYCSKQGALICCLQRDCKTFSHVPCARDFKWLLNESKFWVYCNKHAFRKY